MKTPATFKLSKKSKTMIALLPFKSEEARRAFKKNMIQAEYTASISERYTFGGNTKGKDE